MSPRLQRYHLSGTLFLELSDRHTSFGGRPPWPDLHAWVVFWGTPMTILGRGGLVWTIHVIFLHLSLFIFPLLGHFILMIDPVCCILSSLPSGQTLGRLASLAASIIRGKNLASYHPAVDMGSYVIIVNADKVDVRRAALARIVAARRRPFLRGPLPLDANHELASLSRTQVTGKKYHQKYYFNHTQNKRSGAGRIGGYRIEYFKDLQQRYPEKIVEEAVHGMLPKGRLGKDIRVKHLKVFKGTEHPHTAQAPIDVTHVSRCRGFPSGAINSWPLMARSSLAAYRRGPHAAAPLLASIRPLQMIDKKPTEIKN